MVTGGFPVNHSQQQGKEKEQMTTDISGMKLLESSENVNPDGLLGKMLKALLTSKTAWYSDRCKMIWKEEGFQVKCLVIPASGIGAWHQRKRVWIIANIPTTQGIGKTSQIQFHHQADPA